MPSDRRSKNLDRFIHISCRDDEHSSWTIPPVMLFMLYVETDMARWLLSDMKILELPSSSSHPTTAVSCDFPSSSIDHPARYS